MRACSVQGCRVYASFSGPSALILQVECRGYRHLGCRLFYYYGCCCLGGGVVEGMVGSSCFGEAHFFTKDILTNML